MLKLCYNKKIHTCVMNSPSRKVVSKMARMMKMKCNNIKNSNSTMARVKKENKRNHERVSSNGEVVKKVERQEEVHIPPPNHPEPMEVVENEIYERPKERRPKSCDLIEDGKTPKTRRKRSSKENIHENESQKRPPHKPKSPKPNQSEQNGDAIKKFVRKKKNQPRTGNPEGPGRRAT